MWGRAGWSPNCVAPVGVDVAVAAQGTESGAPREAKPSHPTTRQVVQAHDSSQACSISMLLSNPTTK